MHLGVHGARRGGIPELQFADGPLTPVDVESLALRSHPVILLSGCATAQRSGGTGVEQSFASSFLRAGASAVICTRWPVADDEMAEFTQRLVARWPFTDALTAVAAVCADLVSAGHVREICTSIVIY